MGCDLCLSLWYDLKRLLWQDELSTLGSVVPLAMFLLLSVGFLFWWGFFSKISFVWAFLRILFFWWQTEAWQGSWETFSLCMRCSEVIISATQCVKSAATPCQNVLFRFSTVHFVTPSTPPPDQDLWITKYRAGQNFVPVLQVDLLWTIYQIGTQDMSHFRLLCLLFIISKWFRSR